MKKILQTLFFYVIIMQVANAQFALQDISENSNIAAISQGSTSMADVDGDNDIDLFITGNNLGTYIAKLYLNDGNGNFIESTANIFEGASLSSVAFGDVDNDNDMDVLYIGFTNSFERITKLYINDGNGVFTEDTLNSFTGINRGSIAFLDIDNDNDNDLVLSGAIGAIGFTQLYLNNGAGVFSEITNSPFEPLSGSSIKFSDVDNDNDLDILTAGFSTSTSTNIAKLYINDGNGNYTLKPNTPFMGVAFAAVQFADLDGDLDEDVLITGRIDNSTFESRAAIYLNDGSGNFTEDISNDLIGIENGSVGIADIDNDNDMDIIIGGYTQPASYTNYLYLNNGTGNFTRDETFVTEGVNDMRYQIFADVDNDNDEDLFLFSRGFTTGQATTTLFLNQPDIPELEKTALLDFYAATNGNDWSNNGGWNTRVIVNDWFGITLENNSVTQITLNFNELTGEIPTSITNLTELTNLILSSNMIEGGIPDFSLLPNIETVDIRRNNFDFIDFETNFNTNTTLTAFNYSPQNPRDNQEVIDAVIGEDYSFTMSPIDGTNVQYQWHKGSPFVIDNVTIDGATTTDLNLQNIQSEDLDAYSCFATSALIPDLVIKRETIDLKGEVSMQERDALIAIYNATGGPLWGDNTNWLSSVPVSQWSGVTTTGNKVTSLIFFGWGLNGILPPEIGDLIHLETINISINAQLGGEIPSEIGNLTKLRNLYLQGNNHIGNIPITIGNMTNLRQLRLLWNDLSGPIPSSIGNLANLNLIVLDGSNGNNLSGELPAELGNLTNLSILSIGNNNFEGQLPASLGNLNNLSSANLQNNNFIGTLPFNSSDINVNIVNNFYDFSDIEPFFSQGNYSSLNYSPQRTQDIAENITTGIGADITLNVNDTNLGRSENETAMNNIYQWYKDDVAISNSNSANYTITNAQLTDNGDYFCEITNPILPDLTIVRAPITLNIDPSLSSIDNEVNAILIYPNPTKNWLNIKTHNLIDTEASIYDINGRLVLTKTLNGNLNVLNVEQLQSGAYILKIEAQNKIQTQRFIKQ